MDRAGAQGAREARAGEGPPRWLGEMSRTGAQSSASFTAHSISLFGLTAYGSQPLNLTSESNGRSRFTGLEDDMVSCCWEC